MKILCAYSGIEFTCDHFPLGLYARESFHPIFSVPQRKLLTCLPKWASGELTQTDSYLLFLSLLRSSELVEFRTSARITNTTHSIVAQNMEHLAKALIKLNTVSNPAVVFPHYVVSKETCGLENIIFWIDNWREAYQDFLDGYKSVHDLSKLNKREAALERMIKSPYKDVKEIAPQLAEWAAAAGEFPTFIMESPFTRLQVPVGEYWKTLIIRCANDTQLFTIRRADLEELIEHCETHIPHGSIFANNLMKVLRRAVERQKNFLGIGDIDIKGTKYTLLDENTTVQDANMISMIASAPEAEPKRESYASKLDYLKAKMRWEMSVKYGAKS